jgi:hypothetical protein
MNIYTFHLDGIKDMNSIRIKATDETHAVNMLLAAWLNSKPLTSEGLYKLIHVEKESNK